MSELTLHNMVSRNPKQNLPGLIPNPRSDIAFLVNINSPIQNLHNLSSVFFVLCCILTTYYRNDDDDVHDTTLNITKCFMDPVLYARWHTKQHSVSSQMTLNIDSAVVTVSRLSIPFLQYEDSKGN